MPSVFVFLIFFCFFLQFFQSNNTNSQYTSLQTHFQSINIVWEPSKGISTQSFTRRFSTILPKKKPPKCWHSSKHVTTCLFVFPPQLHLYYTKLWWKNEKIRSSLKASKGVSTQSFKSRISARTTRIKSAVAASGDLTPLKCLNSPFLWSRMKALGLQILKMVLKSQIGPLSQKLRRSENAIFGRFYSLKKKLWRPGRR